MPFDFAQPPPQPLDMGGPQQPQQPKTDKRDWLKLAIIMGAAAKAGPDAIRGVLHGWQQSQAQRQALQHQTFQDQLAQQRLQSEDTQRRNTLQGQELARRAEFLNRFATGLKGLDDDAAAAYLNLHQANAGSFGVRPEQLQQYITEAFPPDKRQQRDAKKRIDQLRAQFGEQHWLEKGAAFTYTMPGEDAPITFQELLRRGNGMETDPHAPTQAPRQTYADLFPATRSLPIGSQALPIREGGAIDTDAATRVLQRLGILGRPTPSRAPRDTSREDRRQRLVTLDEESAYLLRSAARGQAVPDASARWAKLAREYASLGVPFDAHRDALRVRVERELKGADTSFDDIIDSALADGDADVQPSPTPSAPSPSSALKPGVTYRYQNGKLVPK